MQERDDISSFYIWTKMGNYFNVANVKTSEHTLSFHMNLVLLLQKKTKHFKTHKHFLKLE